MCFGSSQLTSCPSHSVASTSSRRNADTYVASLTDAGPPRLDPTAALTDESHRVKVAVRCRPLFRDELEESDAFDSSSVVTIPPGRGNLVRLHLEDKAKAREFYFDRAFPPTTTQDMVYNEVTGPIVDNVLKGYNGTVLAYGQTGTGKTYTMGILDRVADEHAGLIPRALGHIFGHIQANRHKDWRVAMSFLQIYVETVQDLFPLDGFETDENLAVREDPQRGFYVVGLQEFEVNTFGEAVELLNWGLENRVMGCTKMNATSSRSHTVLTVKIDQRLTDADTGVVKTLHGKLLFVDLAGSERVRRTTSKGTRLHEAKSINTSLSALGNVIAALSDPKSTHVPYRDSKLTRLLQESLSGRANTYLIATVGPAPANESETLSTLLFASRCMRVAANPVRNEEVDYAQLCSVLQSQMAGLERQFMARESALTNQYEHVIRDLQGQVSQLKKTSGTAAMNGTQLERQYSAPSANGSGFADFDDLGSVASVFATESGGALAQAYALLCDLYKKSCEPIRGDFARIAKAQQDWKERQTAEAAAEALRDAEENAMTQEDPHPRADAFGAGLTRLPKSQSRDRVAMRHGGAAADADSPMQSWPVPPIATPAVDHPPLSSFRDLSSLSAYLSQLHGSIASNIKHSGQLLEHNATQFALAKEDLVTHYTQKREFENKLAYSQAVIEYLQDQNARLRQVCRQAKAAAEASGYRDVEPAASTSAAGTSPTLQRVRDRRIDSDVDLPTGPLPTQPPVGNLTMRLARQRAEAVAEGKALPTPTIARSFPDSAEAPMLSPADTPTSSFTASGVSTPLPSASPAVVSSAPMDSGVAALAAAAAAAVAAVAKLDRGLTGRLTPTPVPEAPAASDRLPADRPASRTSAASPSLSAVPTGLPRPPSTQVTSNRPPTPSRSTSSPVIVGLPAPSSSLSSVPRGPVPPSIPPPMPPPGPPPGPAQEAPPRSASSTPVTTSIGSAPPTVPASEDVIERIVESSIGAEGATYYKVHWAGSDAADDEWFLREDIVGQFPQVVAQYEARSKPVLRGPAIPRGYSQLDN